MEKKMLVIEDDPLSIEQYRHYFSNSYDIVECNDGVSGMVKAIQEKAQVIILNYEIPKLQAIEICKQIRTYSQAPIIITYKLLDEEEKINCFEAGADDLVQKPISYRELAYRINIHLRRQSNPLPSNDEDYVINFGNLIMNRASYKVYIDSKEVVFTRKEFAILWHIIKKPGEVVTRKELMTMIWGYDILHDDRMIDTHLNRIRKKLFKYTQDISITTVWGIGYKIEKKKNSFPSSIMRMELTNVEL